MPASLPESPVALADDIAVCRAMLRDGSRTFLAASLFLPRAVAVPATVLYAFCRQADDAVDLDGGGAAAIEALRERLDLAYRGRPMALPTDRAFADVVARFRIPRALPEALFDGIEWDAEGRRYETMSELHDYAARVAGSVGAMMATLMGARAPDVVARACDLGVAMQLSNIARDVGEDARSGRLYLPRAWMREAGIDPESWLLKPVFGDAFAEVVRRLLRTADTLYTRSEIGIARLPPACRPGINAARFLYAEIGREVERRGFDSISGRAVVPPARKARVLARALTATAAPRRFVTEPPLAETAYLVDAVAAGGPVADGRGGDRRPAPWRKLEERLIWVLDLFEKLERRAELERSGGTT